MAEQLYAWKNRVVGPNGKLLSIAQSERASKMGNTLIPKQPLNTQPNVMTRAGKSFLNMVVQNKRNRNAARDAMGETLIPGDPVKKGFGPMYIPNTTGKRRNNRKSRKNRRNTRRRR